VGVSDRTVPAGPVALPRARRASAAAWLQRRRAHFEAQVAVARCEAFRYKLASQGSFRLASFASLTSSMGFAVLAKQEN